MERKKRKQEDVKAEGKWRVTRCTVRTEPCGIRSRCRPDSKADAAIEQGTDATREGWDWITDCWFFSFLPFFFFFFFFFFVFLNLAYVDAGSKLCPVFCSPSGM